ncbi:MAG: SDR family NAD(P)-dependent oxidoreductase [Ilumatobacteraceae bacterium]
MNNAIHQPQTVLVLGGKSEIARAIVERLASPALRHVILGCRDPEQVDTDDYPAGPAEVVALRFDATEHDGHAEFVADVTERFGDLDVVVQAFGQLAPDVATDPVKAARLVDVNMAGAVSSGLAVADRLRTQGHGTLVVLSSVAGVRTRPSNFVYGATKAGQDAFATGLGHALDGTGARVLTVRPGFVRTSMTAGMEEAPFTIDAADVADAVARGLRRGSSVVWAPAALQGVFGLLRLAPGPVWRRLDR